MSSIGVYGAEGGAMTPEERFWVKVKKTETCWIWGGARSTNHIVGHTAGPYGHFKVNGKVVQAHRYAYESLIAPIPSSLTIDHLCRNTLCVNPKHLEAVTIKENLLRGVGASGLNAKKTHCKRGHIFDNANTHIGLKGNRLCRACKKIMKAKYRAQAALAGGR